jgi:hypothetical protein
MRLPMPGWLDHPVVRLVGAVFLVRDVVIVAFGLIPTVVGVLADGDVVSYIAIIVGVLAIALGIVPPLLRQPPEGRSETRSNEELATEWQAACDALTRYLRGKGCDPWWDRPDDYSRPTEETVAEARRAYYQDGFRDAFLDAYEATRGRLDYVDRGDLRPRLHGPKTPDDMYALVREINGHIIWALDPSRVPEEFRKT